MERLRINQEVEKTEREEIACREQILRLQKKLAETSISAADPASVPSEYRAFMSTNAGAIEKSEEYYALLKSTLNDLTPQSPYSARQSGDTTNPKRAAENLLKLSEFPEDDDISRTIRGHVSAFYGSKVEENRRIAAIDNELKALAQEKTGHERNHRMTYGSSELTGRNRGNEADRMFIEKKIEAVVAKEEALKVEKATLSNALTAVTRKLQFQQFIVELAVQRRYIHSLIACGFYRASPGGGDLSLSQEAYPQRASGPTAPTPANPTSDAAGAIAPPGVGGGGLPGYPSGASGAPANIPGNPANLAGNPAFPGGDIPFISTISGLESFLLSRIGDAIKDRQAMDNMLAENQIGAADTLLRKMVFTAKYQPELNTVPYGERQRILGFGRDIKAISEALNARDYEEIKRLAARIGENNSDAGMRDVLQFAEEHARKAQHSADQAELAMKAGDLKAAQSLMDAAVARAPMDQQVKRKIDKIRDSFLNKSKLAEEMERIVESEDYRKAYDKANEFGPLASSSSDSTMKARYEELLEREKAVRVTLEKCDAFDARTSYPESWIALSLVDPKIGGDARLVERKSSISGKCPRFVSAYSNATDREKSGADALALAWYLSALAEAPGNTEIKGKVESLGEKVLNN